MEPENDASEPLSSDGGEPGEWLDLGLRSQPLKMSLYDAFTLLVSLQVGSGIFSSPSQVNNHSPSPGASLIIWTLCGAIAWAGAASFAELGAAMPVNGGMQEYLHDIYGPFLAFLASWIWIFAVKPSSMAILSIIFAKYWTRVFAEGYEDSFWLNKLIALTALAVIIFLNAISMKATSRLANFFLYLKLFTVLLLLICCLLFVVFGLHLGTTAPNWDWKSENWFSVRAAGQDNSSIDWSTAGVWAMVGELTMAFYAGLWAYAGWDNANMVAGEMQNAAQELPTAIHTAVPTVIICFLLANVSYYILIPWNEIGTSDTVAEMAGQKILGKAGAIVFALLVSAACLGSININVFTTARLTISAANKGHLPAALKESRCNFSENQPTQPQTSSDGERPQGRNFFTSILGLFGKGPLWVTPIKSMLFNGAVTSVYIMVGTFGALVTFIGIAEYVFFFFTVLGLLVLRAKRPLMPRPYRAFVGLPLIFTLTSLILVVRGAIAAPIQGTAIALLLLFGTAWHAHSNYDGVTWWRRARYERIPA
ncbi:amino acid transporter [Mytilinidion resinicola]|uniref:Amino acid transporter n=1 Tax=Mytilinidion resinicola TaxID=574789 RepID=A0A6A6YEP6_9PEZI|nr:amino acid transporter [Mytilinidion resinicola]KAF2807210.1 amino acid transporter [Mytilinidion resinicola]